MSPVQHCQRCLNHNVHEPRKGHQCPQKACVCWKCKLVVERRVCNRKLSKLAYNNGGGGGDPLGTTPAADDGPHFGVIRSCSDPGPGANKKERRPACAACRHHTGLIIPLRGHKRACPYRNCGCSVCEVVTQRRSIMAKQVKLRRQQQHLRQSPLHDSHSDDRSSSTATTPRAEEDRSLPCADPNVDLVASLAQLQPYESSPQPNYLQSLLAQSATGLSATELLAAEFLARCSQQQGMTPDYNGLLAALMQQQHSPQASLTDGAAAAWSASPSPVASPFGAADAMALAKSPFGTAGSGNLPVIVLPLVYTPQGGCCPLAPTLTYLKGSAF